MENFTPVSALIGGALIGLAATLLLWLTGRIAGVSGIAGGLLARPSSDTAWRAMFVVGIVLGAGLYGLVAPVPIEIDASWPVIIAGGLLVGFGTQLGRGCTSGHGVCGMARLSPRSIAATLVFMASAIATVFVVRHAIGA
ncbi:MAG TPA: YeeE/YedE family protein [Afifellaceae bacterium]|nr:YeeE/YedE family protein [Afifellaceae bacterium]